MRLTVAHLNGSTTDVRLGCHRHNAGQLLQLLGLQDCRLVYKGKVLAPETPLDETDVVIKSGSTLYTAHMLVGGGGDGGCIPTRRDCIVSIKATEKEAENVAGRLATIERWQKCSMTYEDLKIGKIVTDGLGNLFNRSAIVEALMDAKLAKEPLAGGFHHIRSLKDVLEVKLTRTKASMKRTRKLHGEDLDYHSQVSVICPITQQRAGGGHQFICVRSCGCVMSQKGLLIMMKSSNNCPVCDKRLPEKKSPYNYIPLVCPKTRWDRLRKFLAKKDGKKENKRKRKLALLEDKQQHSKLNNNKTPPAGVSALHATPTPSPAHPASPTPAEVATTEPKRKKSKKWSRAEQEMVDAHELKKKNNKVYKSLFTNDRRSRRITGPGGLF